MSTNQTNPPSRRAASVDEIVVAIEAARDRIVAEEIKQMVKMGMPRQMAYQIASSRYRQKGVGGEDSESEFDAADPGWEDIG